MILDIDGSSNHLLDLGYSSQIELLEKETSVGKIEATKMWSTYRVLSIKSGN